jgi:hypothetical protein
MVSARRSGRKSIDRGFQFACSRPDPRPDRRIFYPFYELADCAQRNARFFNCVLRMLWIKVSFDFGGSQECERQVDIHPKQLCQRSLDLRLERIFRYVGSVDPLNG